MKHIVKNHYTIDLDYEENDYNIKNEALFQLATRNNPKRRFLFVSNVLGKHISEKPSTILGFGRLLAMAYYERSTGKTAFDHDKLIDELNNNSYSPDNKVGYLIDEETLVIGFAETATSLAHSVFDSFENCKGFYHTTREQIISDENVIRFEEEHSHATSHKIYQSSDLLIKDAKKIILVDDEISTGNTLINIIREINRDYGVRSFSILTLLDWRNSESIEKLSNFSRENGIDIDVVCIGKGTINEVKVGDIKQEDISGHDIFKKIETKSIINETTTKSIERIIYIDDLPMKKLKNSKELHDNSNYISYTGRFGLTKDKHNELKAQISIISKMLSKHVLGKTLILGTEEFMYIPLRIAAELQGDIKFKSTTRSPIYPLKEDGYPIKSGISFSSTYDASVDNYLYNIEEECFDTILIMVEKIFEDTSTLELTQNLSRFCNNVKVVYFSEKMNVNYPPHIGSYKLSDVTFLLKEITDEIEEQDNSTREKAIQSGTHYSEMLPIEYSPSEDYLKIFHNSLSSFSRKLALAVAVTAEKILKMKGKSVVLVSLARAGTPIGVLLKRYIKNTYDIEVPHYSISIIRGRGIDENAMKFLLNNYESQDIQFIDGWTGKGAITKELKEAVDSLKVNYDNAVNLDHRLAVIADPGYCVEIYGTREDFLIPNACLNSTISGLLSRTVYREDLIGEYDYHGVKYYKELKSDDMSNYFIEEIEKYFNIVADEAKDSIRNFDVQAEVPSWIGYKDVENIMRDFEVDNINFIKPGIGETTRVLLRRIPWKILVREDHKNLEHVLKLAHEKNIPVEKYPLQSYNCCGIVKTLKGE